ncbi:hypothetical protein CH75_08905 [Dyella jiangningensis]|nr:hypothetical protein CH75_08905 [Dyella jiangningensis]
MAKGIYQGNVLGELSIAESNDGIHLRRPDALQIQALPRGDSRVLDKYKIQIGQQIMQQAYGHIDGGRPTVQEWFDLF